MKSVEINNSLQSTESTFIVKVGTVRTEKQNAACSFARGPCCTNHHKHIACIVKAGWNRMVRYRRRLVCFWKATDPPPFPTLIWLRKSYENKLARTASLRRQL